LSRRTNTFALATWRGRLKPARRSRPNVHHAARTSVALVSTTRSSALEERPFDDRVALFGEMRGDAQGKDREVVKGSAERHLALTEEPPAARRLSLMFSANSLD
jgi:hypothetical protein